MDDDVDDEETTTTSSYPSPLFARHTSHVDVHDIVHIWWPIPCHQRLPMDKSSYTPYTTLFQVQTMSRSIHSRHIWYISPCSGWGCWHTHQHLCQTCSMGYDDEDEEEDSTDEVVVAEAEY